MNKKPKLTIELIPATVFYSNVRSNVSKTEWDKLRLESYKKANHTCEICGEKGKDQGYKHDVECHEIWDYNYKTKTQILRGLISLCPRCHQIKHIGRTFAIGKQAEAFRHIENINQWNHKQVIDYIVECFIEHKKKSKIQWKLDITILAEEYGLKQSKKVNPAKKRVTAKPFWKKTTKVNKKRK